MSRNTLAGTYVITKIVAEKDDDERSAPSQEAPFQAKKGASKDGFELVNCNIY